MTTEDVIRGLKYALVVAPEYVHGHITRAIDHIRALAKWQADAQAAMVEVHQSVNKCTFSLGTSVLGRINIRLTPFLPKPDPLVEVIEALGLDLDKTSVNEFVDAFTRHGLKIVEADHD